MICDVELARSQTQITEPPVFMKNILLRDVLEETIASLGGFDGHRSLAVNVSIRQFVYLSVSRSEAELMFTKYFSLFPTK